MGNNNEFPMPPAGPSPLEKVEFAFNQAFELFQRKNLEELSDGIAGVLLEKSEKNEPVSYSAILHSLGKFGVGKEETLDDSKAYKFVGSADRVTFVKNLDRKYKKMKELINGKVKTKNWYESMQIGATALYKLMQINRVKIEFPSLTDRNSASYKRMQQLLLDINQVDKNTDAAWKKMFKEKGYSDEEIYGAEGAYNLIGTFKRATAGVDVFELDKEANFTATADKPVPKFVGVTLKIAESPAKSDKDRYTLRLETGRT